MRDTINITWCPRSRLTELQAFIDTVWRPGHVLSRDAELVAWQHPRPAAPDELSILIAEDAGRMVGMLGIIPCGFNIRGQLGTAAWLALWVVVPEERYRSLGLQLLRRVMAEGYDFVGTLGANAAARRLFGLLRFDVRESVPRWVRIVNNRGLTALLDAGGELYPAPVRDQILAFAADLTDTTNDGSLANGLDEHDAALWDDAWRRHFAPQLVSVDKTSAYLRWRYKEHPRLKYVVRVILNTTRQEAVGLIVYRLIKVKDPTVYVMRIVELLHRPGGEYAIAREIMLGMFALRLTLADFYCTTARSAGLLRKIGFVEESQLPVHLPSLFSPLDFGRSALTGAFSVREGLSMDNAKFFAGDDVYFTRADGDQDRPN